MFSNHENSIHTGAFFLFLSLVLIFSYFTQEAEAQSKKPRGYGIEIGVMPTGQLNAITDVPGIQVGHVTLRKEDSIRTGVTAIIPHPANIFQQKVPAAVYVSNGFGKLTGVTQIRELGTLETPIILTNTLSVPTAAKGLLTHTLQQPANGEVRSVNPVVGETNDGWLNDIRGRHVREEHILEAINKADSGTVKQGAVGAGTGTTAFGFKGGIGTASRRIPEKYGGYRVGVLVQTNFGGVLQINGVPIGKELGTFYLNEQYESSPDGSCMVIVATDAPIRSRNLERLAKRATFGIARSGGIASNGSGDYAIAFSTHPDMRVSNQAEDLVKEGPVLRNSVMSPLFMAAIEATEEAIINSLFAATDTKGRDGHKVEALPIPRVLEIMQEYNRSVEDF